MGGLEGGLEVFTANAIQLCVCVFVCGVRVCVCAHGLERLATAMFDMNLKIRLFLLMCSLWKKNSWWMQR